MSEANRESSVGRRIAKKLLMPLVATAVSSAASYAAKRGPELLEHKVLPKLRELGGGSGRAAATMAERTKTKLDHAGDLADGLTERVRTVAEGAAGAPRAEPRAMSPEQRERQRAERAQGRAARRRGSGD